MAGGADGSIIIDTELDNSGFKHGSQQMQNAINGLTNSANRAGKNMASAIQAVNPALREVIRQAQQSSSQIGDNFSSGGFSQAIAEMQKQAGTIANQLSRLGDSETLGVKTEAQMARFALNVTKARDSLALLIGELNRFTNVPVNTSEYEKLQAEYERLDAALAKLYEKQDLMQQLGVKENSTAYQRLSIQIDKVGESAEEALRKVSELQRSGEYAQMGGDTAQYQEMSEMLRGLATQLEHYEEVVNSFSGNGLFGGLSPQADQATASLENVDNELQQKSTDANRAKISLSGFGHALASISGFAFRAIGGLGRLSFNALTTGAKAAGNAVKSLGTSVSSLAWKGITTGARAAGRGIASLVDRLKSLHRESGKNVLTSNSLVKSLFSIKRMLISRVKRTFISYLFNALRESMNALSSYSTSFSSAMATLKSSFSGLAGNIAVAAGNLVSAIVPAIATIIDWISRAIAMLNAFIALISGRGTYTVAKKGMDDYTESLKSGGGAAEKLNDQVYGFDELNRADDKSGGGGGGTDEPPFAEVPIDNLPDALKKFMQALKDAFAAEEFEKVGLILGQGLNLIIAKIDNWITGTLQPKAVLWAGRIARILNGLVDGVDWDNLGKLVGDGANTIIDTLNTFLTTFDFEKLGVKFAIGVNRIFSTIKWDGLGRLLAARFNAAVNFLHGAITTIDWDSMAAKIAEGVNSFFKDVDWGKLILTGWLGIKSIASAIALAIAGIDFGSWATQIGEGLNGIFNNANWEQLGKDVSAGFNSVIDGLWALITTVSWDNMASSIAAGINGFLKGVNWVKLIATVWVGIKSIASTIALAIAQIDFASWAEEIGKGLNGIFNNADWEQLGKDVSAGFNSVIDGLWALITTVSWDDMAASIAAGINGFLKNVNWRKLILTAWLGVKSIAVSIGLAVADIQFDTWAEEIAAGINGLFDQADWEEIGKAVAKGFNRVVNGLKVLVTNINWKAMAASIGKGANALLSEINWSELVFTVLFGMLSIAATFLSAVSRIDFQKIGKSIADGLNQVFGKDGEGNSYIDWAAIGNDFGTSLVNAIEGVTVFLKDVNWRQIGSAIVEALKNIPWGAIATSIMGLLSQALHSAIELIFGKDVADLIITQEALDLWASETERLLGKAHKDIQDYADSLEPITITHEGVNVEMNYQMDALESLQLVFRMANTAIEQRSADSSAKMAWAVRAIAEGFGDELREVEPTLAERANGFMQAIADAGTSNKWMVVNAFQSIGLNATDELITAIMNGQIPVETAVMGLAHGMNEELLLSITDEELNTRITDFYNSVGEKAGSALGEAAVSSADQGVVSGINALESKADDLIDSLDIRDQQQTLESDNASAAKAGMQAVEEGVAAGTPDATTAAESAVEAVKAPFEGLPEETKAQALLMMQAIQTAIAAGEPEATAAIAVAAQAVVTRAAQILNDGEGKKIGSAFINGIIAGIKGARSSFVGSMQTIKTTITAHSQSTVKAVAKILNDGEGKKIGSAFMSGILSGIIAIHSALIKAAQTTAGNAYNALASRLTQNAGYNLGVQICKGIISGLSRNSYAVAMAARSVALIALNAAKAALGIHSPSKAFTEIGMYMMQGMENGLNDSQKDVMRTVSSISDGIVNGLSDTPSLQIYADTVTTGLDNTVEKLSTVARMFEAIADAITAIGGLSVPAVASGAFTPYKVRVDDTDGLESETDRLNTFTRNFDETMSDQRDVLKEILEAIRNLDLNIDAKALEKALALLQRNKIRAYGGA